jgi:IS4 transposase
LRQIKNVFALCGEISGGFSENEDNARQLDSLYQFLGQSSTPLSLLRNIRLKFVLDTIKLGSDIIISHDITYLEYNGHKSKYDMRWIYDYINRGYEYNACLAIDPVSKGFLGMIHDSITNVDGPDDTESIDYDYEPMFADFDEDGKESLKANHKHQAAAHINGLAKFLKGYNCIHVLDREFDDAFIFISAIYNDTHFVIRATALRNVQMPPYEWLSKEAITKHQFGHKVKKGNVCVNLKQAVQDIPVVEYKDIPLDKEGRVTDSDSAERIARVGIGACAFTIYRIAKRNKKYFKIPKPIDINMVVVREINPPEGAEPLLWVMFTSLPIDNIEDMIKVAEYYELRWKIEVYFRHIKSGYEILKRRFNNGEKLAKYLLLISIVLPEILNIKKEVGIPESGKLDEKKYEEIKEASQNLNDPSINIKLRTFALILKLGGWLGRKGDPIGLKILMKGIHSLIIALGMAKNRKLLISEITMHNIFNLNYYY